MGILARGKILAPAVGGNRAAHDLAVVGRLKLKAYLAALLAIRCRLIFCIDLRDFFRFTDICFGFKAYRYHCRS